MEPTTITIASLASAILLALLRVMFKHGQGFRLSCKSKMISITAQVGKVSPTDSEDAKSPRVSHTQSLPDIPTKHP